MALANKVLVFVNFVLSLFFLGFATLSLATRIDLNAELNQVRGEVRSLQDLDNELKGRNEKLQKEAEDEGKRLADAKKANDANVTKLRNQIQQLNSELNAARTLRDELNLKSADANKKHHERLEEVRALQAQLAGLETKGAELASTKFNLQNELAQTQNLLDILKTRAEGIQARLKALENAGRASNP